MSFKIGDIVEEIGGKGYVKPGAHYVTSVSNHSGVSGPYQYLRFYGAPTGFKCCEFRLVHRPTQDAAVASTDPHAPGAKLDNGKIRAALVFGGFAEALVAVAEVGTFGANKYSPNGWLSVPNGYERYDDAAERHRQARRRAGPDTVDSESKLLHLAHEAWGALALLELHIRKTKGT